MAIATSHARYAGWNTTVFASIILAWQQDPARLRQTSGAPRPTGGSQQPVDETLRAPIRTEKERMKTNLRSLALSWVILGLFATLLHAKDNPIKYYPNFQEQKGSLNRICLFADTMLLTDRQKINLSNNLKWWDSFVAIFVQQLAAKNYALGKTVLTSVGMLSSAELTIEGSAKKGNAPFYLDAAVSADPEFRTALVALYQQLFELDPKKSASSAPGPVTVSPETLGKLKLVDFDALFVVRLHGRLGGDFSSEPGALFVHDKYKRAGTGHSLYVIDLRNGSVIWTDVNWMQGGVARNMRKIVNMYAKDFVKQLPQK
jgi:hypothetical protein